jgi:hypothetical protein
LQGYPQRPLDAAALSQVGAHAVMEDGEAVLAEALGLVHGRVGVLQDLVCGRRPHLA